ncbi:MAG: ATP-binding cassette domain-containing protein, partial [Bowdeniella nasicola]|nr:ATP-binding cassette domain-containing protein [Bowdeniella nasicola]
GSQPILRDITWRLAPGARYGILGGNGAGKTTLLRLLAGELEATTGRIKRGKTVALAKLGQDSRELDALGERRVIEAVNDIATHIAIGTKTLSASQLVERLGFSHQRAYTPVRDLSGGERRRVQFLRLMMAEPNVLLLDEPTNDLDVDVLTAIEDLLDSWPGTLVVVSHDRYLLERLTTRQLAVLPGGQLRDLPGGVDAYLELQASYKPTQPQRAERVEPSRAARQREARKTRQRLERQLEKLEAEIAEVEADLAALASGEDLAELHRRAHDHDTLITQRERIETAWLQAAEAEE